MLPVRSFTWTAPRNNETRLQALGPHSTGNVCLYIRRLADVDLGVLREVVAQSCDAVNSG